MAMDYLKGSEKSDTPYQQHCVRVCAIMQIQYFLLYAEVILNSILTSLQGMW